MKTLLQNSEKERDVGFFQNKLHETTGRIIYT